MALPLSAWQTKFFNSWEVCARQECRSLTCIGRIHIPTLTPLVIFLPGTKIQNSKWRSKANLLTRYKSNTFIWSCQSFFWYTWISFFYFLFLISCAYGSGSCYRSEEPQMETAFTWNLGRLHVPMEEGEKCSISTGIGTRTNLSSGQQFFGMSVFLFLSTKSLLFLWLLTWNILCSISTQHWKLLPDTTRRIIPCFCEPEIACRIQRR